MQLRPTTIVHQLIKNVKTLQGSPRELYLNFLLKFFESYGYFALSQILVIYLHQEFGVSDVTAGTIYGVWGLCITFWGLCAAFFNDKVGVRNSLLIGFSISAISSAIIASTTSVETIYVMLFLIMPIGTSMGIPMLTVGIKRYTTSENRGFAFGLYYSVMNIAAFVSGPVVDSLNIGLEDGAIIFGRHWSGNRLVILTTTVTYLSSLLVTYLFLREIKVQDNSQPDSDLQLEQVASNGSRRESNANDTTAAMRIDSQKPIVAQNVEHDFIAPSSSVFVIDSEDEDGQIPNHGDHGRESPQHATNNEQDRTISSMKMNEIDGDYSVYDKETSEQREEALQQQRQQEQQRWEELEDIFNSRKDRDFNHDPEYQDGSPDTRSDSVIIMGDNDIIIDNGHALRVSYSPKGNLVSSTVVNPLVASARFDADPELGVVPSFERDSSCQQIGTTQGNVLQEYRPGHSLSFSATFKELVYSATFWRFVVLTLFLINLRAIFRHLDATLPTYLIRCFGENYPKGIIYSINPFTIMWLTPVIAGMTTQYAHFDMIKYGGYVSGFSPFFLAMATETWAVVMFVVTLSLGEAIWSPRTYDYTMSIAPEGREATFSALAAAPLFAAKVPVGLLSGYLISTYIPEGSDHPDGQTLWLIVGILTISSPILITAFEKCIREPMMSGNSPSQARHQSDSRSEVIKNALHDDSLRAEVEETGSETESGSSEHNYRRRFRNRYTNINDSNSSSRQGGGAASVAAAAQRASKATSNVVAAARNKIRSRLRKTAGYASLKDSEESKHNDEGMALCPSADSDSIKIQELQAVRKITLTSDTNHSCSGSKVLDNSSVNSVEMDVVNDLDRSKMNSNEDDDDAIVFL